MKMIPAYVHKDIKSNAEKKIFELIRGSNIDSEWVCLHSLGLSSHIYKKQGEIDFLLIGPKGIFCLEVKGGKIERKNGYWYFINRFNERNRKQEGPFEQASSAMFSLMNYLKSKGPKYISNKLFGYGVLFPDIKFTIQSPEWDYNIIYDLRDRLKPFSSYIDRLTTYWSNKSPEKKELNSNEINEIVECLRGNFELVEPVGKQISDIDEYIINFTQNQLKALDRMASNPRTFFRGTAGTGKTVLAMEKAKRSYFNGKRVLFLCYNRLLAGKLRADIKNKEMDDLINVNSLHKYFYETIEKAGLEERFKLDAKGKNQEKIFKIIQPDYFLEALLVVKEEYDVLIIDEGQDLLCEEYIIPLDFVLKGGLEQGEWTIFYDSNNQGQLYQNFDQRVVQSLQKFGAAEYWLDVNCRNTRPIAVQTSLLTEFRVEESLIDKGEKVGYVWYTDKTQQAHEINKLIDKLVSGGVKPCHITILHMGNDEAFNSILFEMNRDDLIKIEYENVGSLPEDKISYASVPAFKGLENKAIIVAGIDRIKGDWVNTHNYVAMTRANALLYLFMNQELQNEFYEKIARFTT